MPELSKTIVHMIGQAHLDPVWLWRWMEGRAEALGTSQSAIDRLAEYPDLHFTRGESQVYSWIEQENTGLFAEIKRLIAAGVRKETVARAAWAIGQAGDQQHLAWRKRGRDF